MKKILLVEDDPIVRENTAEILELSQYQVKAVENGKQALQELKLFTPDLILCDIMMPVMDGYEFFENVLKSTLSASIPFIFLTAKAEKSELRKGMELGADDYITKPFEDTELLNAIETRLKKHLFLKKQYSQDIEGLHAFFDEARSRKELEKLSLQKPLIRFKKKEIIYREGETPHSVFFLNRGKIKIFKGHDEGKEYVNNLFKQGDFFGYIPLLENTLYSDSAMALEEGELYKIPKDDFMALLYKNRDVASQFIKILSNHVSEKEKQLLSLAYDTVKRRVAHTLLLLGKRFSETRQKQTTITITREDLANMTGTATETVIRCLSDFKNEGLINIDGRSIILLNQPELEDMQ